jgi:hypothetical protein
MWRNPVTVLCWQFLLDLQTFCIFRPQKIVANHVGAASCGGEGSMLTVACTFSNEAKHKRKRYEHFADTFWLTLSNLLYIYKMTFNTLSITAVTVFTPTKEFTWPNSSWWQHLFSVLHATISDSLGTRSHLPSLQQHSQNWAAALWMRQPKLFNEGSSGKLSRILRVVQACSRIANWPLCTEASPTYHGHLWKCHMQEMWAGGGILTGWKAFFHYSKVFTKRLCKIKSTNSSPSYKTHCTQLQQSNFFMQVAKKIVSTQIQLHNQ